MSHIYSLHKLLTLGAIMLFQLGMTGSGQAQSLTSRISTPEGMSITNPQVSVLDATTRILQGLSLRETTASPFEAYGTLTLVMKEDFSKMTMGSEEAPDESVDMKLPEGEFEYPWANQRAEYYQLPGWGGDGNYPAGGTVCLKGGYTHINTPLLDLSKVHKGLSVLRFKARAPKPLPENHAYVLSLEAGETFNWSPTWHICEPGSYMIQDLKQEWGTYEVLFWNAGATSLFNIVAQVVNKIDPREKPEPFPILIDDVEVYALSSHLHVPDLLGHRNYKGAEFDLRWSRVDGATKYLLSVYAQEDPSPANPTPEKKYLLTNQEVSDTSYTVTGATSGETYYYTVQAKNDRHVSLESLPMLIYDLEAPVLTPGSKLSEDGMYEASWSEVPSAGSYMYWAYYVNHAKEAGRKVLLWEDFKNIAAQDGTTSDFFPESPDPKANVYPFFFPSGLKMAGWKVENGVNYRGCLCLDGYHYVMGGEQAVFMSPELDFSKDGGKFRVKVDLWGAVNPELVDANGNPVQTIALIGLFNYNEEIEDYEQVELQYVRDVKAEWGTFTIDMTKGSKRSIVGIFAVQGPANLYVDNLEISQNYAAGEGFMYPFLMTPFLGETATEVTVPEHARRFGIYHRVQAIRAKHGSMMKENDATPYLASAFSKMEEIQADTSVKALSTPSALRAWVDRDQLCVSNPEGLEVMVYSASGELLYTVPTGETSITLTLPQAGSYMVKAGDAVVKVVK